MEIVCWFDADQFLGNRDQKNIRSKKATKLVRNGEDEIQLYYHDTPVVTFSRDGFYRLCNGGHETQTTKRRINEFTRSFLYVFQQDREWVIRVGTPPFGQDGEILTFEDGMEIDHSGRVWTSEGRIF